MLDAHSTTPLPPQPPEPYGGADGAEEELIMFLERDQLVADTSVPVPPADLGRGVRTGLWALRVFVLVVSFMVIYTFFAQLR